MSLNLFVGRCIRSQLGVFSSVYVVPQLSAKACRWNSHYITSSIPWKRNVECDSSGFLKQKNFNSEVLISRRWKSYYFLASNIPLKQDIKHDLSELFREVNIIGEVLLLRDRRGFVCGLGIAEVESKRELRKAVKLNGRFLGDRVIVVNSLGIDWYTQMRNRTLQTILGKVDMIGVPSKASEEDIKTFFTPLVPKRIEKTYFRKGKSTGRVYVYFSTHDDAIEAMKCHRKYIGSKEVYLHLDSKPLDENEETNNLDSNPVEDVYCDLKPNNNLHLDAKIL